MLKLGDLQVDQHVVGVQHFTAQYGTAVTSSLDIEARRPRDGGGFDPKTIRIARENATTLRFKTAEFEEE